MKTKNNVQSFDNIRTSKTRSDMSMNYYQLRYKSPGFSFRVHVRIKVIPAVVLKPFIVLLPVQLLYETLPIPSLFIVIV